MAMFLCKTVVFLSLLNILFAKPSNYDDLRNLIETLKVSYDNKISILTERLEEKETECDRKIAALEERILNLETENQKLVDKNGNNKKEILSLWKTLTRMSNTIYNREDPVDNVRQDVTGQRSSEMAHGSIAQKDVGLHKYQPKYYSRTNRALDYSVNIAFTAYLDHDMVSLGTDQALIFNKVLLNDAGGYNNNTGTFIAPVTGVYSISFFVGERGTDEVRAYLVVNNQHKVDAASDPMHTTQDLQGGNTANLRLTKGDSVYITHQGGGRHVEGDNILRTTTFSGFLIYPIESTNIVGK